MDLAITFYNSKDFKEKTFLDAKYIISFLLGRGACFWGNWLFI